MRQITNEVHRMGWKDVAKADTRKFDIGVSFLPPRGMYM